MSDPESRRAPAPDPADIGIVAALPIEVAPLKDRLSDVRKYSVGRFKVVEGDCGGMIVALIVTGPGRSAARQGTELLLAGHRPRWIISTGFAGALIPDLDRHTILVANEVTDLEGRGLSIDVEMTDNGPYRKGRLLTVDQIIRTAAEKAVLHDRTGAIAVDMETTAIAHVCAQRGVRFLSIRIISDTASEELPPEVLTILGPTGSYRLGAAAGAIWKRPSSLKDLWALREHATEAARRLSLALPNFLMQLS